MGPLVLLIILLLFGNAVFSRQILVNRQADIFYVDALTGKDSNSGTSIKVLWKTLDKVNTQLFQTGNQICFRSNTVYNGVLKLHGNDI
ncbi:MAG: hypothetical protein EOP45_14560, partial [Sphingobacteriaceae bacterium]